MLVAVDGGEFAGWLREEVFGVKGLAASVGRKRWARLKGHTLLLFDSDKVGARSGHPPVLGGEGAAWCPSGGHHHPCCLRLTTAVHEADDDDDALKTLVVAWQESNLKAQMSTWEAVCRPLKDKSNGFELIASKLSNTGELLSPKRLVFLAATDEERMAWVFHITYTGSSHQPDPATATTNKESPRAQAQGGGAPL
jgi:hypothetical protein